MDASVRENFELQPEIRKENINIMLKDKMVRFLISFISNPPALPLSSIFRHLG
jgi:hypothetical protein